MKRAGRSAWTNWEDELTPKSYFGLEILWGGKIREIDIAQFPIYDFWRSVSDDVQNNRDHNTDTRFIPLAGREAFSKHFIKTRRHYRLPGHASAEEH